MTRSAPRTLDLEVNAIALLVIGSILWFGRFLCEQQWAKPDPRMINPSPFRRNDGGYKLVDERSRYLLEAACIRFRGAATRTPVDSESAARELSNDRGNRLLRRAPSRVNREPAEVAAKNCPGGVEFQRV